MISQLEKIRSELAGNVVFIVGGGPSVSPNQINFLNKTGHKVICINSSCKFIENPFAIMWIDDSWGSTNKKFLDESNSYKISIKQKQLAETYHKRNMFGQSGSVILGKSGDFEFDSNPYNVRGNNTGTNAVNFVVNAGARKIGLVGFDMKHDGSKSHFHKDYKLPIRASIYSDMFLPSIESMAKILKQFDYPVEIYNCSRHSRIRGFEYKNLREIE